MSEGLPDPAGAGSLIVVPTFNEAENLPTLTERLLALPFEPDLLVVDDNSPDGTGEIAEDIRKGSAGRVRVLRRGGKLGLGSAYLEGFRLGLDAGYGTILQMDADFSHDPADVPRLIDALDRADLALGSRYAPGGGTRNWGAVRKLVSRGGSFYARILLGLPVQDVTGGFKAWRRELLLALDLDRVGSTGYCFQAEMTWRAFRTGARIVEVPILFTDRRVGSSKMSGGIVLEAVWRVPLLALGLAT